MARIEAVEVIAHGVACDNSSCERIEHLRSATSRPVGWFAVTLRRDFAKSHAESGEVWFCSKECMVDAMQWQLSALVNRTQVQR